MADSTTHLDTISASQASKEVSANALFDAMSANALYGRRASTTSALTWGYYGGQFQKTDTTLVAIANGTIALTASATNYLYVDETTGTLTKVTAAPTGWPAPITSPANARAVYAVVTDASGVTSYTDYRAPLKGPQGATGATGPAGADGAPGAPGAPGADGAAGQGVPTGGTAGQQLKKNSSTDYDTSWVSEPFDAHAFYPGVMANSATLLRIPIGRAVTFADDFAGSFATASAASTGSAALDVQKNGASVGTITFATSATGTFVTSGAAVSFAAGDVLSIHGPATADVTLADVGIALVGTR